MKKIFVSTILLLLLTSTVKAGFFSSVAGGMVANSMTGSKKSSSTDNSRSYFIVLNKKINILDLEVKILVGTNILSLILLTWIFFRQRKYLQYNNKELSQKMTKEKNDKLD